MGRANQPNPPRSFGATGHRGGTFVEIEKTDRLDATGDKILHLRVGASCVVTIDQDINAAALAAILTQARDEGFGAMVARYMHGTGYTEDQRATFEPFDPPPSRRQR